MGKLLKFQVPRGLRIVDFPDSIQQWMVAWNRYLMQRYTLCSMPMAAMTSATAQRDENGRRFVILTTGGY